jgi:hypothetical protein
MYCHGHCRRVNASFAIFLSAPAALLTPDIST